MAFKAKARTIGPGFDLSNIPPSFHFQVSGILTIAKEKGATHEQISSLIKSAELLFGECKRFPPAAEYLFSQAHSVLNKKGPAEAEEYLSKVLLPSAKYYVGAASCLTEEAFSHIPKMFDKRLLGSQEFLRELFTTVSMIMQLDAKAGSTIAIFNGILSTPSFEPSMLKTIQLALEKSKNSEAALKAVSQAAGSIFDSEPDLELISAKMRLISSICKYCGPPDSVARALHELSETMPEDMLQADAFSHIARVAKEDAGKAIMALRHNSGASRSFYDGSARGSTPLSFSERRSEFMLQLATAYKEGKILARSLGAKHEDAEVCLNFAYALLNLGRERTEKLYKNAGIEYFMRYRVSTLTEAYSSMVGENQEKPVLLAVMNKNDPNGAFYQEGNSLADLAKHYRVILREVDSEAAFNEAIEQTHSKYGKISTLLIGGHGTPEDILLGAEEEKGKLDLTDREELAYVKDFLAEKPTVVLLSCSTGKNSKSIGAMLSKLWNATLFAPKEPSSRTQYLLSEKGEIKSVRYNVDTSQFASGNLDKIYSKETL